MKVGLRSVDGFKFPNMALMRISSYHKAHGDEVDWWNGFEHYNTLYMSKVFSDSYSIDDEIPMNADDIICGGTGYAITLDGHRETYRKEFDPELSKEIEQMPLDYSIYPKCDFAISMTSRGCPRGCPFCHVSKKEGRESVKVADLDLFYCGQKHIEVLDPNITACSEKRDLFDQYKQIGATINFNQGIDIRCLDEYDIEDLNRMRLANVHFAWDNPKIDLREKFEFYARNAKHKPHGRYGTVYVLTNFNSTIEEDLYRIYTLREMGYDPDVRVYNKPNAPKEILRLQRWCNNRIIFGACKKFEDYHG